MAEDVKREAAYLNFLEKFGETHNVTPTKAQALTAGAILIKEVADTLPGRNAAVVAAELNALGVMMAAYIENARAF